MNSKPDPILLSLICILLLFLTYAGFLAYKSIDFQILEKLESTPLILPSPSPETTPTSTPQILPPHSSTN